MWVIPALDPLEYGQLCLGLRPNARRLAITDVIIDSDLDEVTRTDVANATACIVGALAGLEFEFALAHAGFIDVTIEPSHKVHTYATSSIIRATKPK